MLHVNTKVVLNFSSVSSCGRQSSGPQPASFPHNSTFCYLVFVKIIIIKALTDRWLHSLMSIAAAAAVAKVIEASRAVSPAQAQRTRPMIPSHKSGLLYTSVVLLPVLPHQGMESWATGMMRSWIIWDRHSHYLCCATRKWTVIHWS